MKFALFQCLNQSVRLPGHQAAVLVVGWAPKKTLPAAPTADILMVFRSLGAMLLFSCMLLQPLYWQVQLVSGAADGSILLWREQQGQPGARGRILAMVLSVSSALRWSSVHQLTVRGPTVAASFRPAEYGLMLAVAGSEGPDICFLTRKEVVASPVLPAGEQWLSKPMEAHRAGLVGLCWAPAASPATLAAGPAAARAAARAPLRLVSAASDRSVRIWRADEKSETWSLQRELVESGPGPAVRDVAWKPNLGIPSSSIAVCFEDGLVQMWWQDMEGQAWNLQASWSVAFEACRLAWSAAGSLLAVSGSQGSLLFKEATAGQWAEACQLGD